MKCFTVIVLVSFALSDAVHPPPTFFNSTGLNDDCSKVPGSPTEGDLYHVICQGATPGEIKCVCASNGSSEDKKGYTNLCGHCHDPCRLHFYSAPIPVLKKEKMGGNNKTEV
uniref:Uncharacterized protein n=1 Tax=Lepeophtheirus salmonis TaxID=72036 RepID=A0A0K2U1M1_LEPSM|nr:uncharacterized protein LOC121131803 [Lepeophtheirus salmonis]